MNDAEGVLLQLFLMFAGAKLLGEVFERFRQPAVIGEIFVGVLLGPSLLGLIQPNQTLRGLAEIGAVFLLFTVGLEIRPRHILQVGGAYRWWLCSVSCSPVAMVPPGEVGLIIAAVGLSLHAISDRIYTVVLLMSVVTTLFAPPILRLLLPSAPQQTLRAGRQP